MNESLDDYISNKPMLQAAALRAKLHSSYTKQSYNSEEFRAESDQYICKDSDMNSEPDNKNDQVSPNGSENSLEDSYLALDLNEEDEFDKWCEQLNSNQTTKQSVISTKADDISNCEKNETNSIDSPDVKTVFDKTAKMNKQHDSYFRQLVDSNKQDGQQNSLQLSQLPTLMPKKPYKNNYNNNSNSSNHNYNNVNNNNNYNQNYKKQRYYNSNFNNNNITNSNYNNRYNQLSPWLGGNNNSIGNNSPYQIPINNGPLGNYNINYSNNPNLYTGIDNGMQLWSAQNMSYPTGNVNFGMNVNSGLPLFHDVSMPMNLYQNYDFNSNAANSLNFNMNGSNPASLLSPGCNTWGYNGSRSLNTLLSLAGTSFNGGNCNADLTSYNTGTYAFDNGTHILNELLHNVTGWTGNTGTSNCQLGNKVKKILHIIGDGCAQSRQHGNPAKIRKTTALGFNNRRSMDTANMQDISSSFKGKSFASVLGITMEDLEFDSISDVFYLIKHIYENGININEPTSNND